MILTRGACGYSDGRRKLAIQTAGILSVVLVFCMASVSFAKTVGLEDVFNLALENDPRFMGMNYQRDADEEALTQAWAGVRPTLSAEGVYTETDQEIISSDNTVYGSGESDYPTKEYTVSFVQPLFNMSRFANIKRAKAQLAGTEAELKAERQALAVRVATAYFSVLAAGDRLDATVAEEAAVRRHYELIQGRFSSGLSPRTEFYDAKARLAEVMAKRLAVARDLEDARQALEEIVGPAVGELAALRDELPLVSPQPGDVEVWVEAAFMQNPGLEAAHQEVESARQEIRRQRAGHYPYLNLEADYTWRETDGTLFGGGSEVETTDILARLTLPLYQGGIVSSRTRQAKHLLNAALQSETQQTRALERETRSAFYGVNTAIERVRSLADAVEAQQLALEGKQYGHRSGLFTILAVLDGERDLSLARQNYAMARYDYILNSLMLKKAAGSLEDQDITVIDGWLKEHPVMPKKPMAQDDQKKPNTQETDKSETDKPGTPAVLDAQEKSNSQDEPDAAVVPRNQDDQEGQVAQERPDVPADANSPAPPDNLDVVDSQDNQENTDTRQDQDGQGDQVSPDALAE